MKDAQNSILKIRVCLQVVDSEPLLPRYIAEDPNCMRLVLFEVSKEVCNLVGLTSRVGFTGELTLPHWRECLRPIAARLAQTFRESLFNKGAATRTLAAKSGNKRRSVPGPMRSPLLATPRKASQLQPYATRAWRAPTVEARPSTAIACALCGEPVLKRRRRHCDACMPKARREHGLRAIGAARKALAVQTAAGNDPRRSASVNRVRSEAVSEGHRRNRHWMSEHPGQRDKAWFKREIAPKLDAFTLAEIASATRLSLAACSRIRAGAKVPHPRHWAALLGLVGH